MDDRIVILNADGDVQPSVRGRERAIFGGIGRQFVQQQRDRGERAAADGQVRALHEYALALIRQFVGRTEEHTSELQSLIRISYAVFSLNKKKKIKEQQNTTQ